MNGRDTSPRPGAIGRQIGHISEVVWGAGILCHAFLNYAFTRPVMPVKDPRREGKAGGVAVVSPQRRRIASNRQSVAHPGSDTNSSSVR
jgi:hypothetical protein